MSSQKSGIGCTEVSAPNVECIIVLVSSKVKGLSAVYSLLAEPTHIMTFAIHRAVACFLASKCPR